MDPHYARYGEVTFAKAPDPGEQRKELARWNKLARAFEATIGSDEDLEHELEANEAFAAANPSFEFDIEEYKRLRAGAVLVACLTPVRLHPCVCGTSQLPCLTNCLALIIGPGADDAEALRHAGGRFTRTLPYCATASTGVGEYVASP